MRMRRLQDQVCTAKVLIVADSARRYCPIATTAMLTRNQSWLAWTVIRPGRVIPFPEDFPG
jgi:hypothetical protein